MKVSKTRALRLGIFLLGTHLAPVTFASPPGAPDYLNSPTNISSGQTVTLSWNQVYAATKYVLEQQRNGGSWTSLYSGSATSKSTNLSATPGLYYFRVKACNTTECSAYTLSGQTQSVLGAPNSNKSRVIYIHTDLLGSPTAETDENGNLTGNPN